MMSYMEVRQERNVPRTELPVNVATSDYGKRDIGDFNIKLVPC